jgi:hypothetical protein
MRYATFVPTHAFAVEVLQESLLTEAAGHTQLGTDLGHLGAGASWRTDGSTVVEFRVGAALRSRWFSDSEPEGANCEQQRESKAKGHR